MRKFGFLEDLIKKEWETFGRFSREAGIPKSTISMLIRGRYGSDEGKAIKRIQERLKELRPDLDLSHIWDISYTWHQKYIQDKAIVKNGFRIIVDVKLNEKDELIIAPIVEGG